MSLGFCDSCGEACEDGYCQQCSEVQPILVYVPRTGHFVPILPARVIWRYVTCQSVAERPNCRATVRQERRPNGLWTWAYCADCLAASQGMAA